MATGGKKRSDPEPVYTGEAGVVILQVTDFRKSNPTHRLKNLFHEAFLMTAKKTLFLKG